MTNSDLFELVIFKAISKIREDFPQNIILEFDYLLTEEDCPDGEKRDEICYNSVQWLQKNGYIIVEGKEIGRFFSYVTPMEKLFAVMGMIPPSLQAENKTLSSFFGECAKKATRESISDAIKLLISTGASIGCSAISL